MMLAPICLFTYCRLSETKQTVYALQNNFLATESDLIVFSDGGKDEPSWSKVRILREYLHTIRGFKSIQIIESNTNKGLASSVINGITKVLDEYERIIVIEDDLLTAPNFLDYMNQALEFYENSDSIISISGFSYSSDFLKKLNYDVTFGYRPSSWGWATWRNRWSKIDWEIKDYSKFKRNIYQRIKFNRGGSDLSYMLSKQMNNKINSWAIRFCYNAYKLNMLDVIPVYSLVQNIGFGEDAENCDVVFENNQIDLTGKRKFEFDMQTTINKPVWKTYSKNYGYIVRMKRVLKRLQKKIRN